ncbi:hypothetical protein J0383_22955 [Flavobacterium endoglycinae]|uniref:Uncharacterized protein n=1 Tax=Flavobacterium endoglycinae TaxID=2816357 RepID=A0ABX7QFA5_9FLAO|nr:hypothetical protein [Flavobacterium endoglycinae]QSW89081.1 hypothetical protein J0383_22955 [Flavobacterium endoglycinae]
MILSEKHIDFENYNRTIFLRETIEGIIYGEIKFVFEEGNAEEPTYSTKYPEIDTLDYSIYFKTQNKTIYVFWDSKFYCYGLRAKEIDLEETPNDYEQKWDVSNTEMWINLLGKKIVDFNIVWEEVPPKTIYPQAFILKLEDESSIILSASEFKDVHQEKAYGMSDNLLVSTNLELGKELKLI